MNTIKRLEEPDGWQMLRQIVREVYLLTSGRLRAQGFGRYTERELLTYLDKARISCSERKRILSIMRDLGTMPEGRFSVLYQKVDGTEAKIRRLLRNLRGKSHTEVPPPSAHARPGRVGKTRQRAVAC